MKKIFNKNVKIILSSCLLLFPTFHVAQAECDVGPVLFKDTLFGAAIGVGVGALVLVANQTTDRIAPNLATATLIGAGVGVVVGVVELSLSDCPARHNSAYVDNSGFRARPLFTFLPQNQIDTPNASSVFKDKLSVENLNKVAMGVSVSYTFSN
jgi:hypothetical protein